MGRMENGYRGWMRDEVKKNEDDGTKKGQNIFLEWSLALALTSL